MTSISDLRVGDAERAAVADRLAAHAAAGRLGVEELEQRVERAHAAVRRAELDALLGDLPATGAGRRAARSARPAAAGALAPTWRGPWLRRPPLALLAVALAATVALSLVAGHPLPPMLFVFLALWRWFA
jgi:Domain of unknown function (DUF1707)